MSGGISKNSTLRLATLLALGTACASFAAPTAVQAQGLFETLFGAPKRRVIMVDELPENQRNAFPSAPKVQKKPAPIKKVQAPAYYSYKPEALATVDFAKVIAAPQNAAVVTPVAGAQAATSAADQTQMTTQTNAAFAEGLSGLGGYELRTEKPVAAAIANYYATNRNYIWVTDGKPNARAEQALKVLAAADEYALSPADYSVDLPSAGVGAGANAADLMRFEMALSARVLRYVSDAQGGRINPNKISGYYDFPAKPIDLVGQLTALSTSDDAGALMVSHHPQNPQYAQLKMELASLRKEVGEEVAVDKNLKLKPGQSSPEFPKLMELISTRLDDAMGAEFGPLLELSKGQETYSEDLVPVIKAAQKKAGLSPDGVIGPRTIAAIVGPTKADRLQKVEVALEQLRWLPSQFGSPRVWINQPAFTAQYIEGETPKLSMRTVVGSPSNQTSFFYDEIEQVDYNPYWGVPQSIIVNEMLPRLRSDPGYLDRSGYEVFDSKGQKISSSSVNWGSYSSKAPYAVRQTPSEANALGELKILFPNKHAIYMHDTPQKAFFQRDMRALSHGCIRLVDPRGMAAAILGKDVNYIADKLAKGHSAEKTPRVPVYVSYFTAWPNAAGQVEYFDDVYGRDAKLEAAEAATDQVRVPVAQQVAAGQATEVSTTGSVE